MAKPSAPWSYTAASDNGANERAIRAYSRAGFRVMGRRREVVARGGRRDDLVYMDCLATEFESPALQRLMRGE